ncbi:Pre-mRNA splicing factor PRP21 like protein-domain-containing protein [Lentinula edodes]|uniref:Pre-mRNA splicing factor PRP21 like protein-domain-containing protein n=1 Tax=Lentinula edodes TaxID=5353 RepID=UPI001E8D2818|nr:Pre-mRNA splicing factor PRP21 like protein-domain-containing protein [Lentinula edodes]KAH7877687.1 Pre-mRNA splicing factor PRP21 like protein-domain-containing protein [Lentinula edodes]KAJ3908424.1 Pre-mRNA splicing factor PRP21 like protein-domain-containing protein [Lentinula edodes]
MMEVDVPHTIPNGIPEQAKERFTSGLILPPPEIKSVIDKTASYVAQSANPPLFEDKVREGQRSDPKFSFLNPADPYHAYYRHKMDKIFQGEIDDEQVPSGDDKVDGAAIQAKVVDVGLEPPTPVFIIDMPNISAIDLDTMKLTALFTARRGRNFLAALSAREGRNYQFDFLRPNHSLFGYFNRLVDQYTKIINPDKETLEILKSRVDEGARSKTLDLARKHAKWERRKREKEKRRQDDQEAERIAFAEIDWHDYAIVQTIEFTIADATSELPPPMSVQEVENMTLAQKRMAAMIMENTVEDVEAHRAKQAAAEAEAAAAVGNAGIGGDDAAMEESDDEDEERVMREQEEKRREIERAKALQASSVNAAAGPMKIRTDYVPKLGSKNTKAAMTSCSICGQQIPVDELQEHMRIELLDPRWKEQRDALEARKAQASELQRGANVVSSLKNLARTRVDIFGAEQDEERRKKEEEEERERRKEREKVVWDGHTASKANTLDKFSTNVNFDEQIAAIHRSKGLGPQQANAIGPGIGPAAAPSPLTSLPPPHASLPAPPQASSNPAYSTATVSSGPQPASAYQTPPVMLPPLHFQGIETTQPFGYQPGIAPGMHPSRVAALAAANGVLQSQAGVVRSADQMEGVEDDIPPAKRQKVNKIPGSQIYSEEDWIGMHPHPISLQFQLPTDNTKPEWKFDGKIVTVPDLPLNLLVSTLRERIIQHIGSSVNVSRIRLSYAGKMLTNKSTIASYNMEDEELVTLTLGDAKKK